MEKTILIGHTIHSGDASYNVVLNNPTNGAISVNYTYYETSSSAGSSEEESFTYGTSAHVDSSNNDYTIDYDGDDTITFGSVQAYALEITSVTYNDTSNPAYGFFPDKSKAPISGGDIKVLTKTGSFNSGPAAGTIGFSVADLQALGISDITDYTIIGVTQTTTPIAPTTSQIVYNSKCYPYAEINALSATPLQINVYVPADLQYDIEGTVVLIHK